MIDYDYEDRLLDRIAARKAIAARLTPRQRHILSRCYHYGETYREVGARDGVSGTRISQIHDSAVRKLRGSFARSPTPERVAPQQPTRNTPPVGFDKAAFLRHMRLLIGLREQHAIWERQEQARREREEIERREREERQRLEAEQYALETARLRKQNEFARERAELARLIAREKAKNEPPTPKAKSPSEYLYGPTHTHTVYNSPSYAPPPLPTQKALCEMAHEALQYLLLCRPQHFTGTPWLGKWATSVVFTRDGGSVSEAVNSIVRELPAHAHLSAYPIPIEKGVLGANATTPFASLRVTVTPDGLKLRFDVTWD